MERRWRRGLLQIYTPFHWAHKIVRSYSQKSWLSDGTKTENLRTFAGACLLA